MSETAPIIEEDFSAYAADAGPTPAQSENILASITNVVEEALQAQADVAVAEEVLRNAQERFRVLTERALPELMDNAKQDALTTLPISIDGKELRYDLTRGETLRASIPPANIGAAKMWLTANNADSIVKRELKLQFGKGEDQKAAEAVDILKKAGFEPDEKMSVHPQTLAATLREMIENGVEVPMQLLGAHVMAWVKIKPAKERRPRARGR